jgi:diapolycopene oxygenase
MSMNTTEQTVVIGSGLGGLTAACTLAARGHRVIVIERNDWLGGKAVVLEQDGFRFDMGPTILTLPSVLEKVFAEAGKRVDDYLRLIRLDPQWRCFFSDGSQFDLVESVDEMKTNLESFTGDQRSGDGFVKFMKVSKRLHDVSDRFFFWKSVGGIRDTMNVKQSFSLDVLSDVLSLRFGRTVAGLVRSNIPDPRVAQMVDHFTQYVGSSPEASPAVLCGIAHMQTAEGIWYPAGGTRAIPDALILLASDLGVEFVTGKKVVKIRTESGQVSGVELEGGAVIGCSTLVSNSDVVRTHDELLGEKTARSFHRRRKYEPACSGVVLYLGLKERYDHLLHHNFVFSEDPHEEFDWIYRKGEPAPDPTCYVCAPAITEPEVAPPGGEALYVLIHTPYLRPGHNWKQMLPKYRQTIMQKLQSAGGMEDIEDRIVFEDSLTPEDIDRRYHVLNGAIYGLASHGRFMGAFKPANRSPDVRGLYFAGGAAHPGPGMPMVMMSGWIAADTIAQDASVSLSRKSAALQ